MNEEGEGAWDEDRARKGEGVNSWGCWMRRDILEEKGIREGE